MGKTRKELEEKYGNSSENNFRVVDTIGVPHPYCITPKHLELGRIYLDAQTIRDAEKRLGATCDICKHQYKKGLIPKILSYDEHKTALLIECDKDANKNEELKHFLLKIKERVEKDGYVGFAFMKSKKLLKDMVI